MAFDYTHCLVRGLPKSFAGGLKLVPNTVPIDVEVARHQHGAYVQLLRELIVNVSELAADEAHPDCVFIEDSAVVASGTAVIARSGAPSRRNEVGAVRAELLGLGLPGGVIDLIEPATLDGGDVLLAGGALWVGLSSRTNAAAVAQMALAFADCLPVLSFVVDGGETALHLKSLVTALDEQTLLVTDSPEGRAIVLQAQQRPELAGMEYVMLPDMAAANVLRIGNTVVHQLGFPGSEHILHAESVARGLNLQGLHMSEVAKADAALTCCSILFKL